MIRDAYSDPGCGVLENSDDWPLWSNSMAAFLLSKGLWDESSNLPLPEAMPYLRKYVKSPDWFFGGASAEIVWSDLCDAFSPSALDIWSRLRELMNTTITSLSDLQKYQTK